MNIIVTGASRGIGFELAKLLAKDKKNNVLIISRSKDKLSNLVEECHSVNPGCNIKSIPFDLEQINKIHDLANIINEHFNQVDVLINNAGFLINKPLMETTATDVQKVYNINVFAPFELIKSLNPLLSKSKSAHVLNISSMGGFQGSSKFPGLSAYSSSKAAIASMTECLAEEFKETTIRFNCLALGAVATEMLAEAFPGYQAPTTAVEMAEYIADFALKGHKTFNGKIIPVSQSTP